MLKAEGVESDNTEESQAVSCIGCGVSGCVMHWDRAGSGRARLGHLSSSWLLGWFLKQGLSWINVPDS
jgi:hypothetical protein